MGVKSQRVYKVLPVERFSPKHWELESTACRVIWRLPAGVGFSDGHFPIAKLTGRQVPGCCAMGVCRRIAGGLQGPFAKLSVNGDKC